MSCSWPDLRRRLGDLADLVEVLVEPLAERARLARALEQERRRALHAVVHDRRRHAARLVEQLHAAVVGGDQRALGGRHRDVELALRVLAVDQQRAGDADRDLGDAGEVLDVAGQGGRVERVGRRRARARRRSARASEVAAQPRRPRACSRRTGGGRRHAVWPCGGVYPARVASCTWTPSGRRDLPDDGWAPGRKRRARPRRRRRPRAGRTGRREGEAAWTSGPAAVHVTQRAPATSTARPAA